MLRIGLFGSAIESAERTLAHAVVHAQERAFAAAFDHVALEWIEASGIRETFTTVFERARTLDWCVLSHHAAWVLDPMRLRMLLLRDDVRRAAVFVRAGKIIAKAGVFSPKLAYVDSDFIVVNMRRCAEIGIAERLATATFASHFSDAGGIHADLLALLETIVPYGALHAYDDGSDLQDRYGVQSGFAVSPYLFSRRFGFVSAVPERDPRVHALRAALLMRYGLTGPPVLRAYIAEYAKCVRIARDDDGFPFISRPLAVRAAQHFGTMLKRRIGRVNFEIQKAYDRE